MPTATNPLLAAWSTPFEAPPFAEIEPAHFGPAFEAGLAAHNAEIAAIADSKDPPTFANTLVANEQSGRLLDRVASVFWNLSGAHTNPDIQAIEREIAPKTAAHWMAIAANAALFARIDAVKVASETAPLPPEDQRLVERTHLAFVRAGAKLDAAGKARIAEIAQRMAALSTQFGQNVLADEAGYALPLHGDGDIGGLPAFLLEAAAEAAKERKLDAPFAVTLSRSLIEPFLVFSDRRDLRQTAFEAWIKRGAGGGATDNRAIIAEMVALRHEQARLLGYASYAAFRLADSMARTPERVAELLDRVWPAAKAKAAEERDQLAALAATNERIATIAPWDWRHYSEKVRRARYDLDEAAIKPYLPLEQMIQAAFHTATRLFGVTFAERRDLPVYHADVRVWEVRSADGGHVGLFLGDYFARSSKRSGAWMSSYRDQHRLAPASAPIIVNVMNFAKAADGQPTLLSFDDARTLFHEFGHGLHGLLSDVTYPSLSGTSVARDFVELPSQLFEHWLETPEILKAYARHHQTGEAMPDALIAKLKAARTFNQGFMTVEFLASALVDMALHTNGPDGTDAAADADPVAIEAAILKRIGMPAEIVPRHRATHFGHLFSGGYASGYYSYLWSEVLDADAFEAFRETGDVFDPATAQKLRTYVYGAGGLRPEDEAYRLFRGRMPTVEGLLKKRGLAA